jgi:hypothetical protein
MIAPERGLLLIGSGKSSAGSDAAVDRSVVRTAGCGSSLQRSTSAVLGAYLMDRLGELGFACEALHLYRCVRSEDGRRGMLAAVREASLVVLSSPLFWDSLPAAVTRALELIAEDRRTNPMTRTQRLVAVVNSGFPEASQSETALGICCQFAREAGFEWAGGLALGGGGVIAGRRLEKIGRRVRSVVQALDLTAAALADGQRVPPPAVRLMARPLIPPFIYRIIGNVGWRRRARRFGVYERLSDRPYAP